MGNTLLKRNHRERDLIIFEGLHGSGKTSLLFKLKKSDEEFKGFQYDSFREQVDLHGMTLHCLDLYGREKNRPFVHIYYRMTKGFVYVIDSADKEVLDTALDELVQYILLEESTFGTVVMVLANKQDTPGAMSALEMEEALKQKYKFSSTSASRHTVLVRPCSVKTNAGLEDAFEEFVEHLKLSSAGAAKSGLISLVDYVKVKEADAGTMPTKDVKESIARAKMKKFLKNPFCLFDAKH